MKHDYPYSVMHLQSLIFSYIRAYTSYCPSQDIEDSVISTVTFFLDSLRLKAVTRERVRAATAIDSSMNTLVGLIESGMPELRHELPESLRYFQFKDDFYTADGVIFYKDRDVVPSSLRQEVLSVLN